MTPCVVLRPRRACTTLVCLAAAAGCFSPSEPPPGPYPASLTVVAGDGQTGAVGAPLPIALVVAVADSAGAPYGGAKVRFVVSGGGGSVQPESALTGFDGCAQAAWTLGSAVGIQRVQVQVPRWERSTLSVDLQATALQVSRPSGIIAATRAVGFRPYGVAVSAQDLAYITLLDAGALIGANVRTMALAASIVPVGNVPTDVAFNSAGTAAYVTNQLSGSLGVVDVATGTQVATIPLSGNPFDVAVSPDGARLYVSTNADRVVVVSAATRTVVGTIATAMAPMRMAWHPSGTRLYVAATFGQTVHEIDVATLAVTRSLPVVGGYPQGMAVSPDGAELYVANEGGRLDIWSLAQGALVTSILLPGGGFGLAMTKDASQLYVSIPSRGLVVIVDRVGRTVVKQVATGGDPRDIAFSADGLTAIVANASGWVDFIR